MLRTTSSSSMRTADGWWSVTATISLVVWDETGERKRFASAILPAWARKSPQVAEVLPLLYLHGLSSSDFTPALEQFLGSAAGLSAATITRRITTRWHDDITAFNKRSLTETDYVYRWVDGIHLKVRLDQDRVCLLVTLMARPRVLTSSPDSGPVSRQVAALESAGLGDQFTGGVRLGAFRPRPRSWSRARWSGCAVSTARSRWS